MGIAAFDKKNPISFILAISNLGGHTVDEHICVLNEQKENRLVLILRLSPSVLFKICSLCFVGCVQRYATGQSDSFFIQAMIINSRFNILNCIYYTYHCILGGRELRIIDIDIKLLKTHGIWFKSISSRNCFLYL